MLHIPGGDICIHGTTQQPAQRERGGEAIVFIGLDVTDFCCTTIH